MYWNLRRVYPNSSAILDKLQHEMYWNLSLDMIETLKCIDKLQHEMYWNPSTVTSRGNCARINYNMRCIEIFFDCFFSLSHLRINYNMRCIEIKERKRIWKTKQDKLQHEMYWNRMQYHSAFHYPRDKLQHEMYWNFTNL